MHQDGEVPAGLHLRLPARPDSLALMRSSVRDHGPAEESLLLVVNELVTNAIRHGNLSAEDDVLIDLSYGREAVRVEVTDRGQEFDGALTAAPGEQGGFGLRVVAALSRDWGVIPGTGRVWAEVAC